MYTDTYLFMERERERERGRERKDSNSCHCSQSVSVVLLGTNFLAEFCWRPCEKRLSFLRVVRVLSCGWCLGCCRILLLPICCYQILSMLLLLLQRITRLQSKKAVVFSSLQNGLFIWLGRLCFFLSIRYRAISNKNNNPDNNNIV